jgi:hypothetical protein
MVADVHPHTTQALVQTWARVSAAPFAGSMADLRLAIQVQQVFVKSHESNHCTWIYDEILFELAWPGGCAVFALG